jgi:hypothetical protein
MTLMDERIEKLFDVLTDYTCTSRYDIAAIAGWPVPTVDGVLHEIRKPDVAADWGWTVPHVPRGTGVHLFQVVDGTGRMTADEHNHVRGGAVSTLRVMASHGENEGNALRVAAHSLTPAQSRLVMQTVAAIEGAAAMARHASEVLAP